MSKADNIIQQQKDLQRKLESIQSKCKHKNELIKQLPDKNEWWWQCQDCNKYTHLTSPNEINKYLES